MSNGVATLKEDDKNLLFNPEEVYKD